jgi:hypothetical protein
MFGIKHLAGLIEELIRELKMLNQQILSLRVDLVDTSKDEKINKLMRKIAKMEGREENKNVS